MKSNQEILSSILKTTQMGQIGIRSVLDMPLKEELRRAMESQLREYDSVETEAHSLAISHDWTLPEINPAIRFMTDRMTKLKLSTGNRDSKIAAMMIQGNTSGLIKGLKNLHHASEYDDAIRNLSIKLIDTEASNIQQMKPFL